MGKRPRPVPSTLRRRSTGDPEADARIEALLGLRPDHPETDLVRDMMVTAFKYLDSKAPRADARLVAAALREIRYATKVFAPFAEVRKVTMFGSARIQSGDPSYTMAVDFSRRLAEAGWMVITGAGPGIMQAGNEGAGRDRSFGVNIRLPFEQSANPAILGSDRLVTFRYFFTRKLFFVKESHAVVLFPGGFGTLDEGFEVLTLIQTGKTAPVPVVLLDKPGGDYWRRFSEFIDGVLRVRRLVSPEDICLYTITDDLDRAVHEVLHFYHSSRQVRDRFVVRMHREPSEADLKALHEDFASLLVPGKGGFEVVRGRAQGEEEPRPFHPPWRLVFPFDRRSYGLLRRLVDRVNKW